MKLNSVVVKEINERGSNRATCLKSFHFCKYCFIPQSPQCSIFTDLTNRFPSAFFSFLLFPLRVFLFLCGFISLFFFIVFYLIFLLLITTGTWVELILVFMVPFNTLILLCIFLWKYNVHTENCTNYKGAS